MISQKEFIKKTPELPKLKLNHKELNMPKKKIVPKKQALDFTEVFDQSKIAMQDAVIDWQKKNTPAVIRTTVLRMLDQNKDKAVMALLGFEARWGQSWTVDHCNGRSGESAAGDHLKQICSKTIKEWFAKCPMPEMTASLKKQLESTYQKEFREYALREIRNFAKAAADEAVQDIHKELSELLNVQASLDMKKLLLKVDPEKDQENWT